MYYGKLKVTICLLLLISSACTVKPPEITVTGEKTVLERQLLGHYRLSSKEIFMPAADGGIYTRYQTQVSDSLADSGPVLAGVYSGRREYMIALANHRFNLDDIERFKDLGLIGEDKQGYLHVFRDKVAGLSEADIAVLEIVISEENHGRKIIMKRVINLRADLTDEDLPEIQRIFAKRNIEEEKPGRFIQNDSGEWNIKQ